MKRRFLILAGLAFFPIAVFSAEPIQIINLNDKTIIRGEVLGMKNSIYTVKTKTLGTITINADQILSIVAEETAGSSFPMIIDGKQNRGRNTRKILPSKNRSNNQKGKGQPNLSSSSSELQRAQEHANSRVQSMMMNPDFTDNVNGLNETPEMQEVLSDSETMNAINNFDYESLMNNEKVQKLLDSPEIKKILGNSEGR